MYSMFYHSILLLLILQSYCIVACGTNNDSLLDVLDKTISEQKKYDTRHEAAISRYRKYAHKRGYIAQYNYNAMMADAYKTYRHDSVMIYLNKNWNLSLAHKDVYRAMKSHICVASLFLSEGLITEATNMISSMDKHYLKKGQLADYYDVFMRTFMALANDSNTKGNKEYCRKMEFKYCDSLKSVLDKKDIRYQIAEELRFLNIGDAEKALDINSKQLEYIRPGSLIYSDVCINRARDYKYMDDREQEKYWLINAAINDSRLAVKNGRAICLLAHLLSVDDDTERPITYIRHSWNETKLYNAPQMNIDAFNELSSISMLYHSKIQKQRNSLWMYITITVLLALLLTSAVYFVVRQRKKNSITLDNLDVTNSQNSQLKINNKMKEEYIGRFMSLCSESIDKLDSFRKTINIKAKTGNLEEYLSKKNLRKLRDEDQNELLKNFDNAFLNLFPNFIDEFNALLLPEQQVQLGEEECINTELRIFALVRLGLEDSSEIADFLNYSVYTIYNYRARIRKSSILPKEEFDRALMKIGD